MNIRIFYRCWGVSKEKICWLIDNSSLRIIQCDYIYTDNFSAVCSLLIYSTAYKLDQTESKFQFER